MASPNPRTAPAARPLVRIGHRVALRTGRGPGRGLWVALARSLARVTGRRAAGGEPDASIYTRGGLGRGDFVPGLSDVDVVIVVGADPAGHGRSSERVRRRWRRSAGRLPTVYEILGEPRVLDDDELRAVADTSAYAFGLDERAARPAFRADDALADRLRFLDRPGLVGSTDDWILLSGPERRAVAHGRTPQQERLACWLELAFYWRHAVPACVSPGRPRAPLLCVKLVAEPARILLLLTTGERFGPRGDVLRRALAAFPDEEAAVRLALRTEARLDRREPAPLVECAAALTRFSQRIADHVTRGAFDEGATTVRIEWAGDPGSMPLCDWRAIVCPTHASETLRVADGDPAAAHSIETAALAQSGGAYVALRRDGFLALPSVVRERNRLRAIACPASDPVSFALLDGRRDAVYPDAHGWSIGDVARRAVAEHRARLTDGDHGAAAVLGAARAALLAESVAEGDPVLQVTPAAVAEALGARIARAALDEVVTAVTTGSEPSGEALAAFAADVLRLDALA